MGQLLHGCARTTEALCRSIQRSQDSITALAARHGLNPKTVAKWKRRTFTQDVAMGPKAPRSTTLSAAEEAAIVSFRQLTQLSRDDCLYALQATIPYLTRSTLHRCLTRHGINRLDAMKAQARRKKTFKRYPIGFVHIDIAEVRTEEGKLYLFVAIDRTSKMAYAELRQRQKRADAVDFLRNVIAAFPYRIHTVLTDNGIQFTHREQDWKAFAHLFDRVCYSNRIEHRLTKLNHPWTNGQVERMNRTLKEATVRRYHYRTHEELRTHLTVFMQAYNFAKRLKTLQGLTPYEYVCQQWVKEPNRFKRNPVHDTLGPYT